MKSVESGFRNLGTKLDRTAEVVERQSKEEALSQSHQVMIKSATEMRQHGTTKSKVISKLRPGERADLLHVEGDWLLIRAYDAVSGETREGWVYSKVTRSLQRQRG